MGRPLDCQGFDQILRSGGPNLNARPGRAGVHHAGKAAADNGSDVDHGTSVLWDHRLASRETTCSATSRIICHVAIRLFLITASKLVGQREVPFVRDVDSRGEELASSVISEIRVRIHKNVNSAHFVKRKLYKALHVLRLSDITYRRVNLF